MSSAARKEPWPFACHTLGRRSFSNSLASFVSSLVVLEGPREARNPRHSSKYLPMAKPQFGPPPIARIPATCGLFRSLEPVAVAFVILRVLFSAPTAIGFFGVSACSTRCSRTRPRRRTFRPCDLRQDPTRHRNHLERSQRFAKCRPGLVRRPGESEESCRAWWRAPGCFGFTLRAAYVFLDSCGSIGAAQLASQDLHSALDKSGVDFNASR